MNVYEVVAENGSHYEIQKINNSWCLRKIGEEEWMVINSWGGIPGSRLDSYLDIGRIRLRNELFNKESKKSLLKLGDKYIIFIIIGENITHL